MSDPDIDALVAFSNGRRLTVLTGAGVSTDSGIPDYRGPETRRRARNPIQYRQFLKKPEARRRYWARAVVGYERFRKARPNPGHYALAELERRGLIRGVVTQNVDRLHQAAGSRRVIELHGALAEVVCMHCGATELRSHLQERLLEQNPGWMEMQGTIAPDGDADVDEDVTSRFQMAHCLECGGPLKPAVVFFGESVPKPVVERAYALVDEGDALLVVGSSLAVYSGFRFVRHAEKHGIPVAIVNLGESRGDPLAELVVDRSATAMLEALAAAK
ncbi:MAG: NAD-dependent protein deacetylase [Myxococcota bacterium]